MNNLNELNLDEVSRDVEDLNAIPNEEKLASLVELARELWKAEQRVQEAEADLKAKKEAYNKLSEFKIPELVQSLGISEFKLENGLKLKVKPYFSGKITDPLAYKWLDDNGHAGIIKSVFEVKVPRSYDRQKLAKLEAAAEELGLTGELSESVHHSTLNAWIKETITGGIKIDRELFNVHTGFRASIGK